MAVTIEDMIVEGSMTAKQAMLMGYQWETVVIGGDALKMREAWLQKGNRASAEVKPEKHDLGG